MYEAIVCGVMAVVSRWFIFRAIHRETRLKNRDTTLYRAHTRFLYELCAMRHFCVQILLRYSHNPLTSVTTALYYTQLVKKRSLA
jgi:hypothetical protein